MDTTAPTVGARRWEMYAPLTGIAAVLLFLAAFVVHDLIGDTPDGNAPALEFSRYYQEEDGTIWGGAIFVSLAMAFFLWFLGTLRAALRAAEGGVGRLAATAHAGGIATAILVLAAIGTQVSAALLVDERDEPIDPESAVSYWFMGDGFFLAAFTGAAVLLLATAFVVLRSRTLPRWFGWVTLVLGVLLLVPWVGWAGFTFAFPLWIIVTSLLLWQQTSRAAPV